MTSAPLPLLATTTVLGMVVGASLNVLVSRVIWDDSDDTGGAGGPRCAQCGVAIKARHNLPIVGWLLLRGRCDNCGDGVSVRYLLVEAITGVLFAAVTLRFGMSVQLPAYLFLAATCTALALIDIDSRRLPNSVLLPAYVISALLLMPAGAADANWHPAERALAGALALQAIYLSLALAQPTSVTFGDVKLAGLLGLYLGWLSWEAILVGAVGGLLVGGLTGMAVNVSRGRHASSVVTLGPGMVLAAGGAVFVTVPLTEWYASLVGAT